MRKGILRDGVNEGKGSHLVKWEVVARLLNLGELGIDNIRARNKVILAKWLLQFHWERTAYATRSL